MGKAQQVNRRRGIQPFIEIMDCTLRDGGSEERRVGEEC